MEREFFDELHDSLRKKERLLVRTDHNNFFNDSAELIAELTKKYTVIIITFDLKTLDFVFKIEKKGGFISKLKIIDCVSLIYGKGIPPLPKLIAVYKPDEFNEIQVYQNMYVRDEGGHDVVTVIFSIRNLVTFKNDDEMGMFLYTFKNQSEKQNIPVIIAESTNIGYLTAQILNSFVQKVIPMRKSEGLI